MDPAERTRSRSSFRERLTSYEALYDGTHLSPATPMHPQSKNADDTEVLTPRQPRSWTQAIFFNGTAILVVVAAGIAGYYLSPSSSHQSDHRTPVDRKKESKGTGTKLTTATHLNYWLITDDISWSISAG